LPRSITVPSFAKVNFTLDVLSLREDGFHSMASVMQAVSLHDTITVETQTVSGIELTCSDDRIPSDSTNLAWRAADAALRETGRFDGLRIHVEKRIPSQAGLGGGSSNAAATLRAVDALLELNLPSSTLHGLATALGSDVPFFLTGGTASARGRGEVITPLPDGSELWFVIVKPEVNVSTAWAYGELDAIPDRVSARSTRRMEELIRSEADDRAIRTISRMTNDFEQVIYSEHLSIALLHDEFLMARAENARLCGSGAAVFGVSQTEAAAREVARIMGKKYAEAHVCRSLSRAESLGLEAGVRA
jgi:4-diphosphocytidyl-2-C-methyl-D-erythritol kinase